MAGGGYVASGKAKRYSGKMTGYLWMLCFIGGSGGLLLGYDNGIIGARLYQPAFITGAVAAQPPQRSICSRFKPSQLTTVATGLLASAS